MQTKDDAVFNSIYIEYHLSLRKIAKNAGLPCDEAEDIIQETFLAYFTHYPVDWAERQMKAMLIRILKNKCIDHWRKNGHNTLSLDDNLASDESSLMKRLTSKDALTLVVERDEYRKLGIALEGMRKDWQQIFLLYFVQDRPIREVSDIVGISEDACRMRITRGRKYLRDEMEK